MRLFLWLLLLLLVVLAVRKKFRPVVSAGTPVQEGSSVPAAEVQAENMVCCAHCEVFFPVSEAVYRGDKVYCSVSHADMR